MSEEIKEKIKAYYIANDIDKILNYITNLQQKLEQLENIRKEAIEYINHATIGADSSPIEDSWLYDLYEAKHILNKGDNNVKD